MVESLPSLGGDSSILALLLQKAQAGNAGGGGGGSLLKKIGPKAAQVGVTALTGNPMAGQVAGTGASLLLGGKAGGGGGDLSQLLSMFGGQGQGSESDMLMKLLGGMR